MTPFDVNLFIFLSYSIKFLIICASFNLDKKGVKRVVQYKWFEKHSRDMHFEESNSN